MECYHTSRSGKEHSSSKKLETPSVGEIDWKGLAVGCIEDGVVCLKRRELTIGALFWAHDYGKFPVTLKNDHSFGHYEWEQDMQFRVIYLL